MPHQGTQVFLQRPAELADRVLHPAQFVGIKGDVQTIELEQPIVLELEQDVFLYYELERQFMQQPARITAVGSFADRHGEAEAAEADESSIAPIVALQTTGYLLSAECRECYRVATIFAGLTATLGKENGCALADVSATGFSVIGTGRHELGAVLPATLRYEDQRFSGEACVRSIKTLITGKTRYGLQSVSARARGNELESGQQCIGAAIQRQQLRRRTGS